jgi:hypothetical protein
MYTLPPCRSMVSLPFVRQVPSHLITAAELAMIPGWPA